MTVDSLAQEDAYDVVVGSGLGGLVAARGRRLPSGLRSEDELLPVQERPM